VAFTASTLRSHIPLPKMPYPILGWAVLAIGFIILYDAYDGRGREMTFPLGAITPF
jgi:hypothetical protein